MKNSKSLVLILLVLLLNSCIIKSLRPFYTKDSISHTEKLIGNWTDGKKGEWEFSAINDELLKDKKDGTTFSEDDKKIFENYKDGYIVKYLKNDKEVGFIAMPFKVEAQFFMDFIPLEYNTEDINTLAAEHLLKTHSVAKLDINSNEDITFSWLSEERLKDLFNTKKIRLKHETVGPEENLLLTASSEELYAFLKKFINSDVKDKWKQSDQLTLTKNDAKP